MQRNRQKRQPSTAQPQTKRNNEGKSERTTRAAQPTAEEETHNVQRQSQRIHFGENNRSEGAEGEKANAPRIDTHETGATPARKITCAKTRGSKMQASRCAKQNEEPREMRRAGKSTQPPAGCNGAQKSCNHVLTGSRCPTPITVTHLRTYGQAFDVTRLYIAMWMSKTKDRESKHRQRTQQSTTRQSQAGKMRDEKEA